MRPSALSKPTEHRQWEAAPGEWNIVEAGTSKSAFGSTAGARDEACESSRAEQSSRASSLPLGRVPRVTIGVPVYNCARHLPAALDSLLAQTFTDFELLVSDNASTDETAAIIHRYRRRDSRIRYVRHERNAGAPANWNYVAREARGQYLKWASGNDLAAPAMLARAVEVLDREPAVVLCYGRTELIDEAGASLGIYGGDIEARATRPSSRFIHVCRRLVMNNAQNGLVRLGAVRRTRFNPLYPHGDMVFMAELAMLGHFVLLPEVLFYRRWTPESASSKFGEAARREFYAPGNRSRWLLRFVTGRRHLGLLRAALTAEAPLVDRLRSACFAACYALWAGAGVRRLFGR